MYQLLCVKPIDNDRCVWPSRRYAAQLLTPGALAARADGASRISPQHISAVHTLFLDAKSSARILTQHSDKYMK